MHQPRRPSRRQPARPSSRTTPSMEPKARTRRGPRLVEPPTGRMRRRRTKEPQTADHRRRDQSGRASHVRSAFPGVCREIRAYDGMTLKLISRVNDLFATLSVTLISSR